MIDINIPMYFIPFNYKIKYFKLCKSQNKVEKSYECYN